MASKPDVDFVRWVKEHQLRPSNDYDLYSAYQAGLKPDERGHLPDDYKLTNHITYSKQSLAAQQPGAPQAGSWMGTDDAGWSFFASPQNVKNAGGVQQLVDYFKKYEPQSNLVIPGVRTVYGNKKAVE